MLPVVVAHSDDASSTLHLVGRAVVATSEDFAADLSSLEVEVGLLRNTLGVDPGLVDIYLRTAWEGLQWLHSELTTLESTFRDNQGVSSSQFSTLVAASLSSVNNKIVDIENVVLEEMARLNRLFIFCSGTESSPVGQALVTQFNLIASRLDALETTYAGGYMALHRTPPVVVDTLHSEILALRADLSSVALRQK